MEHIEPITEDSPKEEIIKRAIYLAMIDSSNAFPDREACRKYIHRRGLRLFISSGFIWANTEEGDDVWATVQRSIHHNLLKR